MKAVEGCAQDSVHEGESCWKALIRTTHAFAESWPSSGCRPYPVLARSMPASVRGPNDSVAFFALRRGSISRDSFAFRTGRLEGSQAANHSES